MVLILIINTSLENGNAGDSGVVFGRGFHSEKNRRVVQSF
jgi:hypothetical protein